MRVIGGAFNLSALMQIVNPLFIAKRCSNEIFFLNQAETGGQQIVFLRLL